MLKISRTTVYRYLHK
ncbi:helix-turn-helix domain-containing protein [Bacillus thuringiensis]